MNDTIGLYVCAFAVFLTICGSIFALVYRTRESWMAPGGKQDVSAGAFRSAPVTTDPRPQRRRWIVMVISITSIMWAAVTLLLGLAGALGVMTSSSTEWFWYSIGVAAVDALPLSVMLITSAVVMARRTPNAFVLGVTSGLWSFAHHGAIVALSLALYMTAYDDQTAMPTFLLAAAGAVQSCTILVAAFLARRTEPSVES